MTVSMFDPSSLGLRASERAVEHIRRQLAKSGARALRLGVKESGCSGFMYEMDFVEQPTDRDTEVQIADDVTICVAAEHLALVRGTEIDYVVSGLNAQLKFRNPNAEAECGCGESFSIGDAAEENAAESP